MFTSPSVAALKTQSAEDYWAKNKRLRRPVSPHLTIYKPQITSMLSITHRGTGLALSVLVSGLGIGECGAAFHTKLDLLVPCTVVTAEIPFLLL